MVLANVRNFSHGDVGGKFRGWFPRFTEIFL
jgi:hypothetical protein